MGILFVVGIGLIADRQRFNHRAGDNLGRFDPVFKFALYCLAVCVNMDVLQVIPIGRVVVEKTDFLAFQLRYFDAKVVELALWIVKPGLSRQFVAIEGEPNFVAIEVVTQPYALAVITEVGVGQSSVRRIAVPLVGIAAIDAVVKVSDAPPGRCRLFPSCRCGVINSLNAAAERLITAFFGNKVYDTANRLRTVEDRIGAFDHFNPFQRGFVNQQTGSVVLSGTLVTDDLAVDQNQHPRRRFATDTNLFPPCEGVIGDFDAGNIL